MMKRTHARLLLLALAAALTGCDGADPTGPSPPSSPQPKQTSDPDPAHTGLDVYRVADVTLSGVVYEVTPMGRMPIEGVHVSPDYFHVLPATNVVTDSEGFFSFRPVWVCPCSWAPWVNAGITSIWVDKEGYEIPAGQPASIFGVGTLVNDSRLRDVTIDGDTRFDIELVRR